MGCRETEDVVHQILEITTTGSLKNKDVILISLALDGGNYRRGKKIKPKMANGVLDNYRIFLGGC